MRIPLTLIIEEQKRRRTQVERAAPLEIRVPLPGLRDEQREEAEEEPEKPNRGVVIISMFGQEDP